MNQNSTNVFNNGLNFDLNPITTPNNVLTDCVNGTFITFNGDELALQNDAGNTKIAVPGTSPVEYVTLSPGFLPLGIKEYGGVLYIVSAKTPDTSSWVEWTQGSWDLDAIVYQKVLDEMVYYKSLVDNNTNALPITTDLYWEVMGSRKDTINKLSEVEFGSYPSPEGADVRTFPGIPREYNNSIVDLTTLYKKLVINDAIFKSSRYIIFDGVHSDDIDSTRVSGHTLSGTQVTETKLFWKLKLFHYLSNGYFDLTSSVEELYATYLQTHKDNYSEGLHHWYYDDEFRYYCPTQFKGQLAVSLEIEPLTVFTLHGYPGFSFNGTVYKFELNIDAIGAGLITVPNARVEIWIGNVPYDFGGGVYYEDITITDTVGNFVLDNIPDTEVDKEIKYRITPIIEVQGVKYAEGKYPDAYDDLPQEYIDQFVITGSRLVDTLYDDVIFEIDGNYSECIDNISYMAYKVFTLKSAGGDFLDLDLAPTVDPHVFVRVDIYDDYIIANPTHIVIATFDTYMPDTYTFTPKDVVILEPTVFAVIITMFKKQHVVDYSETCDSSLSFTPTFVGITNWAAIHLLTDTGDYKYIGVGATAPADAGEVETIRNCVDYDPTDHLVFIGEPNGYLMVVDVADPFNPHSKEISIASDQTDLSVVKILNLGTKKEIYIASRNGKVFRQPYYSNWNDYITGYAQGMQNPPGLEDCIRDFAFYGGYIYAIGARFEFYRIKTDALGGVWNKFADIKFRGYKVGVGQQYMWWPGHFENDSQSERIMAFSKSNPISGGFEPFNLPHPVTASQFPTDITMLTGDDLLVCDTRAGQGLWKMHGTVSEPTHISRLLWPNYDVVDNTLYIGGSCFDGSQYSYTSFKKQTNPASYIPKIRAFNNTTNTWGTEFITPGFYRKLFLY